MPCMNSTQKTSFTQIVVIAFLAVIPQSLDGALRDAFIAGERVGEFFRVVLLD